jgi:hypothetical protein
MLVARDRMPRAGRRGLAPLTAVEIPGQATRGRCGHRAACGGAAPLCWRTSGCTGDFALRRPSAQSPAGEWLATRPK